VKLTDDSRAIIVHDVDLVWRRSGKWVACLGPEYFVHFTQPHGCSWRAFKPFALEPIAVARTLDECVLQVKQHYDRRRQEGRARVKLILEGLDEIV